MIEMVNDNWRSGPRVEVCTFESGPLRSSSCLHPHGGFVSYGLRLRFFYLAFLFSGTVLIVVTCDREFVITVFPYVTGNFYR